MIFSFSFISLILLDNLISMPYDSVCMSIECIQQRKAFFEFSPKSQHIINKHDVKSIHPISFISYFPDNDDSQKESKSLKGKLLCQDLIKFRDQAFQKIVQSIRQIFFENQLINTFKDTLMLYQECNIKTVLTSLSQGSYSLLEPIKLFQTQDKETNFDKFLFQNIEEMHHQIKNNFLRVKDAFMDIYSSLQRYAFQTSKPEERQVVRSLFQERLSDSQHNQNQIKVEYIQTKKIDESFKSLESLERQQSVKQLNKIYSRSDSESQDQQSNGSQKSPLVIKYKPINKQQLQKPQKKRRKRFNLLNGFQFISNEQFKIYQGKYPMKTFEFLKQKCQNLKILHLFHQKLANQAIIKKIMQYFPKISRITLNCFHQFEPNVFKSVPKELLTSLTFDVKWDMSMFFTQYYAYQHFPFRSIKKLQRKKEISLQQLHEHLPYNNSIWINDTSTLQWVNSRHFNYSIVTMMRFNASFPYDRVLKNFRNFKNIKVLVLSGSIICKDSQFLQFIANSPLLQTVVLEKCKFHEDNLNVILKVMQKLQNLSKLSITNDQMSFIPIKAYRIFRLTNITHLNIQRYQFNNQSKLTNFENLKDISKLTKLKHLSLYSCYNQAEPQLGGHELTKQALKTQLLSYLSKNILSSLLFLNLGNTKVDNSACHYIKRMKSLVYLNIDETRIQGEALIEAFRSMSFEKPHDSSLKQLSIQNKKGLKGKFTQQHLQTLAKYLPELQYLNIGNFVKDIAFIEQISSYDFSEFKKLKDIALSETQLRNLDTIISSEVRRFKVMDS